MKTSELFKGRWHYWTVYHPRSLIRLTSKKKKHSNDREFPLGFSSNVPFAIVRVFLKTFQTMMSLKKRKPKGRSTVRCGPEIQPMTIQSQYPCGRYCLMLPSSTGRFQPDEAWLYGSSSGGVIWYSDTAWWPQPLLNYKVITWFSQTLVPNLQVCVQQLY